MAQEAKVTVYRFDPAIDKEPRYETYSVPAEGWQNLSVLDTIRYIYAYLDGSLSFRESCRCKIVCSICAVSVNKKVVLACDTPATQEMCIEPVPNRPVIKDLAVRYGATGPD